MVTSAPITHDIRPLLPGLRAVAAEQDDILALYLFGSYASGSPGPLSDVDLAVLFEPTVPRVLYGERRIALFSRVAAVLRTDEVDIVVLNAAPPLLLYQVLRRSVLLYEKDSARRARFAAQAIRQYLDFEPTLDRCQKASLARIKDKGLRG